MRAATIASLLALALWAIAVRTVHADEAFPEPASLRSAVDFWTRIYTEVGTGSGFLHDARHLGVVYATLHFSSDSRRLRQRLAKRRKAHWRTVLARLARGTAPEDAREQAVVASLTAALGHAPTPRDYRTAARRLRFQLGQRDKFRAGLIRAGAYEDRIHAVFRSMGLPEDLGHLPHVESSFHPRAYSKYGAAGIWQFIRSTGRLYLNIDYVVDERLDPMLATRAAARLLRKNYEKLGTWPLAITAYNHGTAGMERAKRRLGTDDIGTIVHEYEGRTFGFASRNFYAQFLAARKIAHDYRAYFGDLQRDTPERTETLALPFYADVRDLERYLGVGPDVVARHNPALRPPVIRGHKRVPAGYALRVPAGTLASAFRDGLAAIPEERRYDEQAASRFHTVSRGETLDQISKLHGTSISTIVALNNLRSRHRIYPGQVLELLAPDDDTAAPVQTAAASGGREEAPPAEGGAYTVRRGDTLSGIAQRHGTSIPILLALNDLRSPERIYPGQRLRLAQAPQAIAEPVRVVAADVEAEAQTVAPRPALAAHDPDTGSAPAPAADTAVAAAGADISLADTSLSDTAPADTAPADTALADSDVADTSLADTALADTALADSDVADMAPADTETLRAYEVARGDTLEDIARRYDTTVPEIVALNDLGRWIYPGQELKLAAVASPPGDALTEAPVVADADTEAPVVADADTAPLAMVSDDEPSTPVAVPGRPGDSRWRRIDGGRIVVDAEETLGHYAEWLEIPTQRLRNLNHLRFGHPVHVGQRLRLDFSRVSPETFNDRRLAYHKAIEEDFLGSYRVTGLTDHILRRGENLWQLSHQVYEVPPWLLHRFNPETDFTRLQPGTRLLIPVVEPNEINESMGS